MTFIGNVFGQPNYVDPMRATQDQLRAQAGMPALTTPAATPGSPAMPASPMTPTGSPSLPAGPIRFGMRPQYMGPQRRSAGYRFADPRAARHMAATTARPTYPANGVYAPGTTPNNLDPATYSQVLASLGYYQHTPPQAPQQQQGGQYPFQIPGLGDFYTPHSMGDVQNTSNSTVGANFLGNYQPPRSAPPRPF